ncbi:MAG: DUF433 domain-containing protein [Spirochaetaceae bacterium]|nr:DUF433 domain-containing protein [Spirochaetaceae bacterium]
MATDSYLLERITVRSEVFGGKPIIRDMRIAVEHVVGMLAAGDRAETILDEYPDLEPEDIHACLLFGRRSLSSEYVHEQVGGQEPARQ